MPTSASQPSRPKPWDLLFNIPKSFRLVMALLRDPRIAFTRKILFFGTIGFLIVALLLPETVLAGALEAVLPFVGPAISLPPDAALDWTAIALASFSLLRVFPSEVVSEHFERIFHRTR